MGDSTISGTRPERDFKWLSQYLNEAQSYHADFVRRVDRDLKLFHYTDLNGMKAIATEHDLWLTHALYCNDEAEIKLGIEIAREEIRKLMAEVHGPKPRKTYLQQLDAVLAEPQQEGVYICCFCQDGDDLSQWRAYGGDGNGVSIQIIPQAFEKYAGASKFGFLRLWNVFYPEQHQRQIMRRALETTYTRFSRLSTGQIVRKAKDVVDFFVPTFKHPGFGKENEWRLIFAPSPHSPVKPRYRAKKDMLIPYYSFKDLMFTLGVNKKTWRLPIQQVCIGPSRHKELNCNCAKSLLTDNGYKCPAITSKTPYRS